MQSNTDRALTVIIPTYNRPEILRRTVDLLTTNLAYFCDEDGRTVEPDVHIYIGNDGDELDVSDFMNHRGEIRIYKGPGLGLGANLNMLLSKVETPLVMQLDDDHQLVDTLDITLYARDLLNVNLNIGWIRLFLGEEQDVYSLKTYYKFQAANHGPYWFLDVEGRELYLASNRPHIKRLSFHHNYGMYDQNVSLGQTEVRWCKNYKYMRREFSEWIALPWVVIPMFGLNLGQWQHVGKSWQKEGF